MEDQSAYTGREAIAERGMNVNIYIPKQMAKQIKTPLQYQL